MLTGSEAERVLREAPCGLSSRAVWVGGTLRCRLSSSGAFRLKIHPHRQNLGLPVVF